MNTSFSCSGQLNSRVSRMSGSDAPVLVTQVASAATRVHLRTGAFYCTGGYKE